MFKSLKEELFYWTLIIGFALVVSIFCAKVANAIDCQTYVMNGRITTCCTSLNVTTCN